MGKDERMMLHQALEYPGDERHGGSNGKKHPLSRCSVGMVVTVLRVTSTGAAAAVGSFVMRIVFIVVIATAMVVAATFLLVRGRCSGIFFMMRVTMLIHNSENV